MKLTLIFLSKQQVETPKIFNDILVYHTLPLAFYLMFTLFFIDVGCGSSSGRNVRID